MATNVTIIPPKDDFKIVVEQVVRIGDDIDVEYRRQARLYARISWFSATAKHRVRQLKNELEVVMASVRKNIRQRRHVKLTKDELHDQVIRKKRYCEKHRELEDAIYHEELVSGLLRALEHKKDALTGLGANYRHGGDNEELRMLSKEMKNRAKVRKATRGGD